MFSIHNKKHLIIGGILILIIALALFGGREYTYIKALKKALESDKKALKDSLEFYKNEYHDIDIEEKTYEKEYIWEKSRRIKAERVLKDIKDLQFPKKYLDSLKDNIIYK